MEPQTPPILGKKHLRMLLALQALRSTTFTDDCLFFNAIRTFTGREFRKEYTDNEQRRFVHDLVQMAYVTRTIPDQIMTTRITKGGRTEMLRIQELWERGKKPWCEYYLPSMTPNVLPVHISPRAEAV